MVEIFDVSKTYGRKNAISKADEVAAISNMSITMPSGEVFGLVGTNGAGKTTLLRILAGIIKEDSGVVLVDEQKVYNNPAIKRDILYIPDDPYYFSGNNAKALSDWYKSVYPNYSEERFHALMNDFSLNEKRRISSYSKGMRKQLAIIIALSAGTKYLLCDETMDGLDPVMRQATKSLIANDMQQRGLTTIMTSHNLRELEDICDKVGLMHQGGVLMSKDIADMKVDIQKLQVVYRSDEDRQKAEAQLPVLDQHTQGKMHVYTVRKSPAELEIIFGGIDTVFYELLPLTLEEIFISETEANGYDIRRIISE